MTTETNAIRIQHMTAENVLRLRAVEIEPNGAAVVLGGKNCAGKSSVLATIAMVFGGGELVPDRPIKDGAKRAVGSVDCGEFKLTRTWKRNDNGTLKIEGKTPGAFPTTQTELKRMFDKACLDPLAWSRLADTRAGGSQQREDLLRVADLPIDLDANLAARKTVFDSRTAVNRDVKSLKGTLDVRLIPASAPEKPVDVSALAEQYREAVEHNDALRNAERHLAAIRVARDEGVGQLKRAGDQLRNELAEAEAALAAHEEAAPKAIEDLDGKVTAADEALSALGDVRGTDELTAQMENARELNAAYKAREERAEIEQAYGEKKAEADALTAKLTRLDDERETALKDAKLPIEGLGFDEDGVNFNGMPFVQLSQSERLRISCAMAMALNKPENGGAALQIMLVKDGALLDEEHLQLLIDMATENGFQPFIEVVGDSDHPAAIIIEDGAVMENANA